MLIKLRENLNEDCFIAAFHHNFIFFFSFAATASVLNSQNKKIGDGVKTIWVEKFFKFKRKSFGCKFLASHVHSSTRSHIKTNINLGASKGGAI